MSRGRWVSLYSGGKDSSWALHRALEVGLDVGRLLTVHPTEDSYLYHVPATDLVALAAESIGVPLVEVDQPPVEGTDSTARGDAEIEPLEEGLRSLAPELGGIAGLIVGAVESEYQRDRVKALADRLDAEVFAPLWREDPVEVATAMIESGFEIRFVQVAADGLGESWLGRRLDEDAVSELRALNESHGVHVLGEGGEFETLVTDGPHMSEPIEIEAETVWEGARGHLAITDAWLD
ncbi:MAG: diphthine--ammonia ligase [Halanaeroarchaeum sp.]